MAGRRLGNPCWFELATRAGGLDAAGAFYRAVLGWKIEDSGMEGFDYHLANADGDMVAGLMVPPPAVAEMPPFWMIYFAVDDADAFVTDATAEGAVLHRGPEAVPGTGRFALLSDPQGAAFGILQPDMGGMSEADIARAEAGGAFNPGKAGHGAWNELMTSDPEAGFAFYSKLFGWTKGDAVNMGDAGVYQILRRDNVDIGGVMGLGQAPAPNWLPYFGLAGGVSKGVEAIRMAGGVVHHGPTEVPGGTFIALAQDPQGAWFAVTGATE